ncbi:unnamed protein product [Protopolystoma xenopodis]|uniref:Uncharacterized protein n=1 Tax=Protopolystoma xenopodis TaxID=117903 RepID=A0A3S5AWC8_9PLAT|nr:unnamed protein product [Protopolystoma xenopodis]
MNLNADPVFVESQESSCSPVALKANCGKCLDFCCPICCGLLHKHDLTRPDSSESDSEASFYGKECAEDDSRHDENGGDGWSVLGEDNNLKAIPLPKKDGEDSTNSTTVAHSSKTGGLINQIADRVRSSGYEFSGYSLQVIAPACTPIREHAVWIALLHHLVKHISDWAPAVITPQSERPAIATTSSVPINLASDAPPSGLMQPEHCAEAMVSSWRLASFPVKAIWKWLVRNQLNKALKTYNHSSPSDLTHKETSSDASGSLDPAVRHICIRLEFHIPPDPSQTGEPQHVRIGKSNDKFRADFVENGAGNIGLSTDHLCRRLSMAADRADHSLFSALPVPPRKRRRGGPRSGGGASSARIVDSSPNINRIDSEANLANGIIIGKTRNVSRASIGILLECLPQILFTRDVLWYLYFCRYFYQLRLYKMK